MSELPDFVHERIDRIHQRTEIDVDEITRAYWELFGSEFVQSDPQFKTDEERHRYSNSVMWSMYVARRPVKEFTVVPIGLDGIRTSRAGNLYSTIYAVVKGKNGIARISCSGAVSNLIKEVNLFNQYVSRFGEFSGGDLQADNRTKFQRPRRLKLSPHEFMNRLNIKRIPSIIEAKKYPSATGSDGYADRKDWRVIRGIVTGPGRKFTRDDNTEGGVYTLADTSIDGGEAVTDEGDVISGLTAWTAPELMSWQQYDEVDAYGTVSIKSTGEPNMNAYLFLPIHARGRGE